MDGKRITVSGWTAPCQRSAKSSGRRVKSRLRFVDDSVLGERGANAEQGAVESLDDTPLHIDYSSVGQPGVAPGLAVCRPARCCTRTGHCPDACGVEIEVASWTM
jgi:hypothetical protein